jgi:excisionase family DNA binding protein
MSAKMKPSSNGVAPAPLSLHDVLTLAQAAAYLQLSPAVVRAEADGGRLRGRRVGDDWRFVRDELIRWVRGPSVPDRDALLAVAGCLSGDETLTQITEEAYRLRALNKVGGG